MFITEIWVRNVAVRYVGQDIMKNHSEAVSELIPGKDQKQTLASLVFMSLENDFFSYCDI